MDLMAVEWDYQTAWQPNNDKDKLLSKVMDERNGKVQLMMINLLWKLEMGMKDFLFLYRHAEGISLKPI